ncbi:CIR protein PIR protein [Plasmodium vinckei brucechwatti]|uniref:CIR protein PIR protein n=1 Tax=Plasmodium vinckei brucechwatti TaxID=119398 RepID=A0A6V7RU19_PLAVN|nr:CIR protein PIR protein [Plasmodium vinckei brucechwatti]
MAKEVCKIFQDVDEYFVNNKPDFDKINKIGNYMQDCYDNNPSEPHKCKDDLQGIKVLCSYIFTELHKISKDIQRRENNDNQYVEYAMMWLGYRLFQEESYSSSTLRNFYNNDLMKSDLFNNYTDLIKKKEHLKDVNLYYMKRLYELFKELCYMTLKYSKNNLDMNKIQRNFNTFQNKYRILYDKIDECNSYLILLNSIKVAYGHFKRSLITSIPNNKIKELHSILKDLNPRIKLDKTSTPGFNSRGCKSVNSRAAKKPFRPVSNVPKAKPAESSPHPHQSQSQAQQQKPEAPPTKQAGSDKPPPTSSVSSSPSPKKVLPPPPPQIPHPPVQQVPVPAPPANPESVKPKTDASSPSESSQQPSHSQQAEKQPKLQSTAPSSEPQRAASPETQPPVSDTTTQKGSTDSQGVSNAGASQLPNQENTSKGSDSDQHNSAGQIKEQGGNTAGKPERPQDGKQENSDSKQANSIDVPKNGTEMKTPQLNDPSTSIKSPNQGGALGDPKKTETGDKHSPTLPQIKGQQAESSPSAPSAMHKKESQNDNSQQSHKITDSHISGGATTPSDSESKDTGNIKKPQENKQGTIGDEQKDSRGSIGNESSPQSDPSNPSHSSTHPLTSGTNQRNSDDGSVGGSEHTNGGSDSQGSTDSGSGGNGSDGSDSGTGDGSGGSGSDGSDSGTGGGPSDSPGSPGGGKDNGGGAPGSGANDGSSGGSKTPVDQATTHSPGASDGYLSSFWRTRLSPMNYIPSIPDIYETPKNILASTANKITSAYSSTVDNIKYAYDRTVDSATNAYNSTMIVVKDTYNSTVTNITNAYTISTNYISGAVSSITNQLSSLGSFSQLGDDQPELGGSGNSLPTDNNPPSTTQTPKPDPNPPSSSSQSMTLPLSPLSPANPSGPQIPSDPSSPKSLDPQPISTQNFKSSDQQSASNAGKGVSQIPLSAQVTLASSGISPLNIGNGNNPSGIDAKINENPSIWCIRSNKKCDILSIGIIGISILAFLAIMYKYISFESAKNSKKKKIMKRVIKYGDGNRKTQIIIKSYDRNKHLKPIINSVVRKKYPLLNIYKLMQADPVPFINLFFLLIFFVYKRKDDSLKL